jgi:hypothetical protein
MFHQSFNKDNNEVSFFIGKIILNYSLKYLLWGFHSVLLRKISHIARLLFLDSYFHIHFFFWLNFHGNFNKASKYLCFHETEL